MCSAVRHCGSARLVGARCDTEPPVCVGGVAGVGDDVVCVCDVCAPVCEVCERVIDVSCMYWCGLREVVSAWSPATFPLPKKRKIQINLRLLSSIPVYPRPVPITIGSSNGGPFGLPSKTIQTHRRTNFLLCGSDRRAVL